MVCYKTTRSTLFQMLNRKECWRQFPRQIAVIPSGNVTLWGWMPPARSGKHQVSQRKVTAAVQSPGAVRLSATPGLPVPLHLPGLPQFTSTALVMPSSRLILRCPLPLCPQSFPESETFPVSRVFTSDDQNTGASAPVLPKSIEGWFPLRLTGLISLLSEALSRVFSNTIWRHQFLVFHLLYGPTLTSDYFPLNFFKIYVTG